MAPDDAFYGGLTAITLDPGGTTGLCVATMRDDELKLFVHQEKLSLHQIHKMLMDTMQKTDLHVIYESFEYRNFARSGLDLTPVKIIGVIELIREQYEPFVKFYSQTAATGKAFFSNDKLKNLGVYTTMEHGRDATRHFLQWAKFGAGGQWIDLDLVHIELLTEWPDL